MDLLEIKKQHVSAYHWPSSCFISKVCCNSVIQLLQTSIGVEISSPTCLIRYLLFAISTIVKSWCYPVMVYLHRWWTLCVGWCLDSLCAGSIMDSLVCHYPFVLGVNTNGGLSSRLMCVWTW